MNYLIKASTKANGQLQTIVTAKESEFGRTAECTKEVGLTTSLTAMVE